MMFDADEWRVKAKRRAEKQSSCVVLRHDYKNIRNLSILIDWCESRGIEVEFTKDKGGTYFTDKKIKINYVLRPEKQLHTLLHECGHHLIGDREHGERFGMGYLAAGHVLNSLTHKVDVLDEELEAWHRGLQLASRLSMKIDQKRYLKIKARYIKSYAKWVSGKIRHKVHK